MVSNEEREEFCPIDENTKVFNERLAVEKVVRSHQKVPEKEKHQHGVGLFKTFWAEFSCKSGQTEPSFLVPNVEFCSSYPRIILELLKVNLDHNSRNNFSVRDSDTRL